MIRHHLYILGLLQYQVVAIHIPTQLELNIIVIVYSLRHIRLHIKIHKIYSGQIK